MFSNAALSFNAYMEVETGRLHSCIKFKYINLYMTYEATLH